MPAITNIGSSFNMQRLVNLSLNGMTLSLCYYLSTHALAEASNVEIGANYSDRLVNQLPGGVFTFVLGIGLVILLLVILGAISGSSSNKRSALHALANGPSAQNLFLGIKYAALPKVATTEQADAAPMLEVGYLRSLGVSSASFVSSEAIQRDGRVRLYLGTLPGFPNSNIAVEGNVIRCKYLGGSPESFLIQIRFNHMNDQSREPLISYLATLTSKPRALTQA